MTIERERGAKSPTSSKGCESWRSLAHNHGAEQQKCLMCSRQAELPRCSRVLDTSVLRGASIGITTADQNVDVALRHPGGLTPKRTLPTSSTLTPSSGIGFLTTKQIVTASHGVRMEIVAPRDCNGNVIRQPNAMVMSLEISETIQVRRATGSVLQPFSKATERVLKIQLHSQGTSTRCPTGWLRKCGRSPSLSWGCGRLATWLHQ